MAASACVSSLPRTARTCAPRFLCFVRPQNLSSMLEYGWLKAFSNNARKSVLSKAQVRLAAKCRLQ